MHVTHRFFTRACAVATAGVALAMWGVTAASASGGGVPIHQGAGFVAGRGGALPLTRNSQAIGTSTNAATSNRTFAGYEAGVTAGSATVVATSFTVPTLSCTTATRAITPDAGVAVAHNASASLVIIACANGKPKYFAAAVTNGKGTLTREPFAAGDVIDLTTKVSTTRSKAEVTDVNSGVTVKRTGVGASTRAAWIGDDPAFSNAGALLHVPDFGKLTFKNCLVDGTAFGSLHPRAFQRVNSNGTVQISTGGFFPGGTAFTTHFKHS